MIYINDDVVMVYILSHVISRSFPTLALQLMITGSFYVTKVYQVIDLALLFNDLIQVQWAISLPSR